MKNSYFVFLLSFVLAFSSCEKEVWVFDSPANDNLELPLLFTVNNKDCALDIKSKSFRFPIEKTTVSNFSAHIKFQDYSSVEFNGILLKNNQINELGDIEINTPYSLVFTTEGEVNTYKLYFTTIPTVQLIAQDKIQNEPKTFARIIVNYKEENKTSVNSFIGIEYRGVSTLWKPKKSMGFVPLASKNIDNKRSLPFFDYSSNNKWILDAMYVDKAKARNKTSLELWQTLPSDIEHLGTHCEYVEVFLNYESLGLFSFCEGLSYEYLSLNPQSILITGKHNSKSTYFESLPDKSPRGPYWHNWEQKVPDSDLGNNWDAFEELATLIVEKSDDEFIAEIGNQIDIDNFIDYYLFVNMSKAYDDIAKNWFFLKKSDDEKFVIVPWDLDASWGRIWTGSSNGYDGHHDDDDFDHDDDDDHDAEDRKVIVTNGLYERLISLNPNQFKQKLKARWAQVKDNELSTNAIIALFNHNFDQLNQSNIIAIDNEKWKKDTDINSESLYINEWIEGNWIFIDNYINSL